MDKDIINILIIIYLILIIFVIIFILYESYDYYKYYRTLEVDGYKVFMKFDTKQILNELPDGYGFINYKYQIKGCSLSTFHRDVTSSQTIFKTKYPVYTCITYKNTGDLLTICPASHKTTPFLFERPLIIRGNKNTTILFNCDIIHAGAINKFGNNRHAIQFKLCHKDDLKKLKHLIGIDKISIGKCNNSWIYEYVLRKISLLYPFFFNHVLTKLLQERPEKDSMIELIINKFYIGDFYNS